MRVSVFSVFFIFRPLKDGLKIFKVDIQILLIGQQTKEDKSLFHRQPHLPLPQVQIIPLRINPQKHKELPHMGTLHQL